MPSQSRRAYLRALALAGASALAGCPGNGATDSDTRASDGAGTVSGTVPTEGPTAAETPTSTATPSETSTPTETSTETRTPTATPERRVGGIVDSRPEAVWPLPERSVANDAYDADGTTVAESPSVAWRATAKRPEGTDDVYDPDFSGAVVADGRVFATNALLYGPEVPRPDRQLVRAFDTASGEERWTHTVVDEADGVSVPTEPVVGDGVVYVATGETVHVLDPATGDVVRTRSFPGDIETVTPAGDRTFVVVDDAVYALDADGDTEWSTEIEEHVGARPALGTDRLYVGAANKQLYALDPETGEVAWNRTVEHAGEIGYAIYDVVALANGVVVRRANDTLYAFDDAGERVWYADRGYHSVATDGTRLYCGRGAGDVHALDVTTGEVRWERDYEGGDDVGRPVVTGDRVYVTDEERLVAARPGDGTEVWRTPVEHGGFVLGSNALFGVGYNSERDRVELAALR